MYKDGWLRTPAGRGSVKKIDKSRLNFLTLKIINVHQHRRPFRDRILTRIGAHCTARPRSPTRTRAAQRIYGVFCGCCYVMHRCYTAAAACLLTDHSLLRLTSELSVLVVPFSPTFTTWYTSLSLNRVVTFSILLRLHAHCLNYRVASLIFVFENMLFGTISSVFAAHESL